MQPRLPYIMTGKVFDAKSGKLHIFRRNEITVMRGWPEPMAWQKTAENPQWRNVRPKMEIIYPHTPGIQLSFYFAVSDATIWNQRGQLAIMDWQQLIPRDVRLSIAPYPNRHWHLLQLAARCGKPGADLLHTNPAVAYALASGWVYHPVKRHLTCARNLLKPGRDQRDILEWLGFPSTNQVRRITSRIIFSAIDITSLFYLRDALKDQAVVKRLSHLSRLNAGVLRIATDLKLLPWANLSLLNEVANSRNEDGFPQTARVLRDCVDVRAELGIRRKNLSAIRTCDELYRHWNDLAARKNLYDLFEGATTFPEPPIPGSPDIVPIETVDELIEEGTEMKNCVASPGYIRAVQKRILYIYSVKTPVRCTLSVAKLPDGTGWQVDQLRAVCNGPVPAKSRDAVRAWLSEHGHDPSNAALETEVRYDAMNELPPLDDNDPF